MKKRPLVELSVASLVSDANHLAPPADLPALTVAILFPTVILWYLSCQTT